MFRGKINTLGEESVVVIRDGISLVLICNLALKLRVSKSSFELAFLLQIQKADTDCVQALLNSKNCVSNV